MCGWKALFEGAGGSLDPCPEEQDKGPSGVVPDVRSQHDVEDFGSDDETDCIPGPSVAQSAWEVPPEEEFGMNGPEDLLAIQAQELPPEWAGSKWEGWGSTLHHRK